MKTFKIQSMSDIITNSSSEVFMIFDQAAIKTIVDSTNVILRMFDETLDANEIFSFEPVYDRDEAIAWYRDGIGIDEDDENADEEYEARRKLKKNDISKEMLDSYVIKIDEEDDESFPLIKDYKIIAKDEKYKALADAVYNIVHAVKSEERMC